MLQFLSLEALSPFLREAFGAKRPHLKPLSGGLLNQNMLLTAGGKKYVLKAYRPEMPSARIAEMHRAMAFAAEREIPVTLPIAETAIGGHVVAIYPFVSGTHPPRYRNPRARMVAMGEMLGRIHAALDAFRPKSEKPSHEDLVRAWRVESAQEEIRRLRGTLRSHPAPVRREIGRVLDAYERIYAGQDWGTDVFRGLPVAPCHGDYHTQNILMRGTRIVAVLDWEKAGWDFRGKEIMRSVIFNCRKTSRELHWPSVESYLEAYRTHASIGEADRRLAFECGMRNLVFGFWAVKQYLAGHAHFRRNILRRLAMAETLVKDRAASAERIAAMLK